MSEREWFLFCEDIIESIGLIEEYTKGMGLEEFAEDRKTIDAVVRNMQILTGKE